MVRKETLFLRGVGRSKRYTLCGQNVESFRVKLANTQSNHELYKRLDFNITREAANQLHCKDNVLETRVNQIPKQLIANCVFALGNDEEEPRALAAAGLFLPWS